MPAHIPRTQWQHRQDHNALRFPCGNCKWWFKSIAGRTRHQRSAHPIFTAPTQNNWDEPEDNNEAMSPQPLPHIDTMDSMDDTAMDANMSNDSRSSTGGAGSPDPNINAEFFGPGGHLYHNYHMKLNGMFTFSLNFLSLASRHLLAQVESVM